MSCSTCHVSVAPDWISRVPAASEDEVLAAARAEPNVAAHLDGKTLRRVIHVAGKLLNLVVS